MRLVLASPLRKLAIAIVYVSASLFLVQGSSRAGSLPKVTHKLHGNRISGLSVYNLPQKTQFGFMVPAEKDVLLETLHGSKRTNRACRTQTQCCSNKCIRITLTAWYWHHKCEIFLFFLHVFLSIFFYKQNKIKGEKKATMQKRQRKTRKRYLLYIIDKSISKTSKGPQRRIMWTFHWVWFASPRYCKRGCNAVLKGWNLSFRSHLILYGEMTC